MSVALAFDDLMVGTAWRTAPRLVDVGLIAAFADLTGDRAPIHLDADAARAAGYPGRVAHGLLVLCLATGLLAELGHLAASTLALRRVEWAFAHPVLEGETITCHARVAATRVTSSTAGLVDLDLTVADASARALQQGRLRLLVRRTAAPHDTQ